MAISTVYKNILANYAGAFATTLIAFLLTPVYISYLGVGSYGIIGFFLSLQAIFIFLDMGIGAAVNREMARHYHDKSQKGYLRNLSHSLQVIYWGIGLLIGVVLFIAAPILAQGWFKSNELPTDTVTSVFIIFALTMIVRWPYGLYSSGLRGMQHQVTLNVYELFWNLAKSIGSWLVLKYISPTLTAFLWYQFIITVLQTSGIVIVFWKYLSVKAAALKFDTEILKNLSRYAAGMGIGIILANLVAQLDKIIVSKMVSDTTFGYYSIANNIAMLVYSISLPMYMAIFPHFTKHVQDKNEKLLTADFHYYAKLLSTLLLPFGVIIIFNAETVLHLWLKQGEIAEKSAVILQWLMCSTICNALMMPVHTLLVAKVRIRFMIYSQIIELICMVPVMYVLINKFGVKGGAMGMFILYFCYLLVQAPLIFRTIKSNHLTLTWYLKDILLFLPPLILIGWGFQTFIFPYFSTSNFGIFSYLVLLFLLCYATSFAINRSLFIQLISRLKAIFKPQQ